MAPDEGYPVAESVRTGRMQVIALPPPVNNTASDAADQKIIREEAVRAIVKRKAKLDSALKKGFARPCGINAPRRCATSWKQATIGSARRENNSSTT